jgi:hypothetical protein
MPRQAAVLGTIKQRAGQQAIQNLPSAYRRRVSERWKA